MKALSLNTTNFTEEQLYTYEEKIALNPIEGYSHFVDDENNRIVFYKFAKKGEVVSMASFMEQGKVAKEFLIENGINTAEDYKTSFALIDIPDAVEKDAVTSDDFEALDAKIYQVPKDDPKLVSINNILAKLKNNG